MNRLEQHIIDNIDYNPDTGILTWKETFSRTVNAGKECGGINGIGYIVIKIKNKLIKAHRIAWLIKTGSWPKNDIDHINGVRSDNRWGNLRDISRRENSSNQDIHRNGKLVGGSFDGKKYNASITINGKRKYIGRFNTELEAHEAYLKEKSCLQLIIR